MQFNTFIIWIKGPDSTVIANWIYVFTIFIFKIHYYVLKDVWSDSESLIFTTFDCNQAICFFLGILIVLFTVWFVYVFCIYLFSGNWLQQLACLRLLVSKQATCFFAGIANSTLVVSQDWTCLSGLLYNFCLQCSEPASCLWLSSAFSILILDCAAMYLTMLNTS